MFTHHLPKIWQSCNCEIVNTASVSFDLVYLELLHAFTSNLNKNIASLQSLFGFILAIIDISSFGLFNEMYRCSYCIYSIYFSLFPPSVGQTAMIRIVSKIIVFNIFFSCRNNFRQYQSSYFDPSEL